MTKMLSGIGLRAEWTTSGKEAVLRATFAKENGDDFHVYIIDWLMPDMNGVEVVRKIRKIIGEVIPIIILTAYDWSDIEKEAKEAGVTAFCEKPIFLSELRNILLSASGYEDEEKKKQENQRRIPSKVRHILLVEDVEMNREIAQTVLEEAGFIVDCAENGVKAVEKVNDSKNNLYDLILMDIQMPVMDGYEATKIIRSLECRQLSEIPIIAMTANAFAEDVQASLDAGMNGHLAKPIVMEEVKKSIIMNLNR